MDVIDDLNAALAGKYRLEREIGAGGMAVVYLARDLRHGREVAVKVMNAELGAMVGAERFLSEISVMAGLHHPHLLPLFDSGEAAGLLYYVMPLVKGASLRTRLDRERQLPVHEAIRIAVAVAGALDHAHRHGVVHRDLKPENVLLHDGEPLVADFGIALAISRAGNDRITRTGMAIGTPQYASPEQAAADRDIDGRSDIYSLGAVLYEMLTADPPHTASTLQGVIARLMIDRPKDIRTLRESVPEYVAVAVERALEKLPADRFSTAAEFASTLSGGTHSTPGRITPLPRSAGGFASRLRDPLVAGLAALSVVGLGAAMWQGLAPVQAMGASEETVYQTNLDVNQTLASGKPGTPFAVSRDGSKTAYLISELAQQQVLFLKHRTNSESSRIPNTDGALHPSFAPNGESLAFVQDGRLKVLELSGGSPKPRQLSTVPNPITGTSWGVPNEVIVGQERGGLFAVPVNNADPRALTTPDSTSGEISHRWPVVIDDGSTVLFTSWRGATPTAMIGVVSYAGGDARTLDLYGSFPLGVLDGHLIYADSTGMITAVAFDVGSRRVLGKPFRPGANGIVSIAGAEKAALSASGTLIYQRRQNYPLDLVRINRNNATQLLFPDQEPQPFADPRISPDGSKVAVTITSDSSSTVWVYPLDGSAPWRVDGRAASTSRPEWAANGRSLIYRSDQGAELEIWQRAIGRNGQPTRLIASGEQAAEALLTNDGTALVFRRDSESRLGVHLWWRALAIDSTPRQVLTSTGDELAPALSPTGPWVAFASNMSGNSNIYLAPVPGPGEPCQVSTGGGTEPAWSSDGLQIYYRQGEQLLASRIESFKDCLVASPTVVFENALHNDQYHRQFDILPGDTGFLALRRRGPRADLEVILDFPARVRSMNGGTN
jgi:serine/threonine-protein kinase